MLNFLRLAPTGDQQVGGIYTTGQNAREYVYAEEN